MARRAAHFECSHTLCGGMIPTLLLAGCFALAILTGGMLAMRADGESIQALDTYLHFYLSEVHLGGGISPALWAVIWELCRWPILLTLLGFTALGALAIPMMFCVRGFLLSYAISSFLNIFGRDGMGAALALFGVSALIVVPVLFLLASWAFPASIHLAIGNRKEHPQGSFLSGGVQTMGVAVLLLVTAVILQWSVMPPLLSSVLNSLFPSQ